MKVSVSVAVLSAWSWTETAIVAVRKQSLPEAAEQGVAIAHQVFGAIGFTKEHILHRFTMRALGWRDDFGNESHWALALGRKVAANGADELWPMLAAR